MRDAMSEGLELVEALLGEAGVCRYCRCSPEEPCRLRTGDDCHWINGARNCCSNPACERARLQESRSGRDGTELARRQGVRQAADALRAPRGRNWAKRHRGRGKGRAA